MHIFSYPVLSSALLPLHPDQRISHLSKYSVSFLLLLFLFWWHWISEVTQSCPTLCDPMDCSPPGSSIHGILQARILGGGRGGWVAISFSRGSSQPRDLTQVSRIAGRHFNLWATRNPSPIWPGCNLSFKLNMLPGRHSHFLGIEISESAEPKLWEQEA